MFNAMCRMCDLMYVCSTECTVSQIVRENFSSMLFERGQTPCSVCLSRVLAFFIFCLFWLDKLTAVRKRTRRGVVEVSKLHRQKYGLRVPPGRSYGPVRSAKQRGRGERRCGISGDIGDCLGVRAVVRRAPMTRAVPAHFRKT